MNSSIPNMVTDVANQYKNHFKGKKARKIQSHKGRHGLSLSRDSSQPHGHSDEE